MGSPMFALDHVSFGYTQADPVLRDVSLQVERGMYVALLGANGSGKSTLARHLNGLLVPQAGQVRVDGLDTARPENILPIRMRVGMVFQNPDNQIVATTVEDDVAFGLENLGVAPGEIQERVTRALEATGLGDVRLRPPHLLSGGQKQRLAIASTLAMAQEAVILDEATSSLDATGRRELLALVRSLHSRGGTILTVTHRMEEVLDAQHVFVLGQGRLVMQGTPREIFARVRELRELNLSAPDVAQIAGYLGARRPSISSDCFTAQELLAELRGEIAGGDEAAAAGGEREVAAGGTGGAVMIEVAELSHTYLQGTPLEHVGLRRADLEVRAGEAVAIVGATGSGKSTLMQHLNGLLRPQTGRVVSAGVDLTRRDADVIALRRRVGLLFQNPEDQLFEQLVGDDIAFGPFRAKWPIDKVRDHVRLAMKEVGLDFDAFKDRPIFALSGGEKRKVALAGVLALRPQVLVLDEPTAGLDPKTAEDLLDVLGSLKAEGVSLVFVTHNLDEVLALADRIVILDEGETKEALATEDVIRRPELLERRGFTVPPLLQVLRGVREMGLGTIVARRPDEAARAILAAIEGRGEAASPAAAQGGER